MAMLPVRRDPAPLATRPVVRPRPPADAEPAAPAPAEAEPIDGLDGRIRASVDSALAEALKKVSTPEDDELAKQQAAFDRLMAQRAEDLREANAIREFGLEQAKHEDEFMKEWIRMI